MRKFIKNPYAERLNKNGCDVRVTRGGEVVHEYFVSPEEIAKENELREQGLKEILENRRVQS